jgi:tetratricopeptide (TPR) repeat protein
VLALAGVVAAAATIPGCGRRKAVEHYNRGVQLAKVENYAAARAEFAEALRLRPKFPEAHNSLGYVLNQLGRYEEAIPHFQAAADAEKFRGRPLAYLNLGTAYSNAHDYDAAQRAVRKSLELEPTAQGYYVLAQVYAVRNNTAEALDALERCLALESQRVYAVEMDTVFDGLRTEPRFRALLDKHRK